MTSASGVARGAERVYPGLAGLEGNVKSNAIKSNRRKMIVAAGAVAAGSVMSRGVRAGTDTVPAGNTTSLRTTTPGVSAVVPTVSLSGSTAMRNFIISPGFTLLNSTPGNSITLGPIGNEVTYTFGGAVSLQFAQKNFNTPDVTTGAIQSNSGLRVEWHEQGSVEGMLEMADGQINDNIYSNLGYNPTTGNAVYINQNKFGGTSPAGSTVGQNPGGHQLDAFTSATDRTTAQAQSPVQMAISDVNATQGFSKGGVTATNSGAYMLTATQSGYGKGNPALPVGTLGAPGVRFQLQDESMLNMPAGATDPNGGTYSTGAWNNAGVGNLNSKAVAISATLFVANPGTGLTHINRTDAQWLQMAGRLKNGADFNMTTRDAGSGTRNVAAANTGIDPSWAVGENDAGNGNSLTGGTDQTAVGPGITFSNKTAGGGQLRPVVQRSRMAVGTLGMSDAISSIQPSITPTSTPLRALDYRDDADDKTDGDAGNISNGASFKNWSEDGSGNSTFTTGDLPAGKFIRASAANITNGSYVVYQNEQLVTVRAPNATDYSTDKVKGDNSGHDVADVRDNVLNSVVTFGSGTSVATPADSLIDNSFILPQMMQVNRQTDGLNQSAPNATYDSSLRSTFLGDSRATKFDPDDPATIKQGNSALYGANVAHVILNGDGSTTNVAPLGGPIPITANNYFFGDFKRDNASTTSGNREVRDYSDLAVAQKAQAALAAGGSVGWDDAADPNSRVVSNTGSYTFTADMAFTPTKGDLIAMGDFNSDGNFDGKDLYLMAHGAALADSTSSTTLSGGSSGFADSVRNGVLRKNAALEELQTATNPATYSGNTPTNPEAMQRASASANVINDPKGVNAFNERDVNRDGLINFVDAVTSDKFFGQNYTDIDQQLAATSNVRPTDPVTPISLVDAEMNDTGNIDQSDLDVIDSQLVGTANESWSSTLMKTGAGAIATAYTGGTFTVASGSVLQISGGTVNVGGSADMFTDNTASATNGNHVSITTASGTAFNITAGTKAVGTISGTGTTSVASGATLSADSVQQGALVVNGNLNVRGHGQLNTTNTLAIGAAGKMDLSDNKLIVHTTPSGSWNGTHYDGVAGMIQTGRNNGSWDGNGLVTSTSDASMSKMLTTLAVAQASDVGYGGTRTFGGQAVSGTDTLVMYTYAGDADLSGKINGDDYFRIDSGYMSHATGYTNGDFNYDGKIDADDYFLIDKNYSAQGAAFPQSAPLSLGGVVAVPEPGSAAFMVVVLSASLNSMSRRRRR